MISEKDENLTKLHLVCCLFHPKKGWQPCFCQVKKVSLCEDFTMQNWMVSGVLWGSTETINPRWVEVDDHWAFSRLLAIFASWASKLMADLYSIHTCHSYPEKLLVSAGFDCNWTRVNFVKTKVCCYYYYKNILVLVNFIKSSLNMI